MTQSPLRDSVAVENSIGVMLSAAKHLAVPDTCEDEILRGFILGEAEKPQNHIATQSLHANDKSGDSLSIATLLRQ